MRWLSRFLWLAAWCAWVWLGFGLYRELPRQVGQRLSQIPIDRSERVLGFVNDTPFVVVEPRSPTVSMTLKVFDGRTGLLSHEVPFDSRWPMLTDSACRSHGVLFARGRGMSNAGFGVVDLTTGQWKMLSEMMVLDAVVHPKRPWVAFRESARPIDKPRRLVVVDFRTGDEVFLRPQDSEYVSLGAPLFVGESDRLVVPISRATEPGADDAKDVEVWRLASPAIREKVIRNVRIGSEPQTTTSGRIAWRTFEPTSHRVDVFDLDAERVIFSTSPTARDPRSRFAIQSYFRLSSTGRALMSMSDPQFGLRNVETGEMLWHPSEGLPPGLIEGADLFEVEELWDRRLPVVRLGEWRTNALYDLDDASLQFRCWSANAPILEFTNADFSLGVNPQGAVHRLPFRVNWPLLVLGQMILALPLLLVWLILHRRPRRSLREITP
jgi:hypothetical protein